MTAPEPAPNAPRASVPTQRVALVIGIEAYLAARPLANPTRDARAIELALKDLGFRITVETDRSGQRLAGAIDAFAADNSGADALVVFFAGHGVQIDGRNFLLPIDARIDSAASLRASSLALDDLLGRLASVAPRRVVLLDACRNNPFGSAQVAAGTRGFAAAEMDIPAFPAIVPGMGRIGRADGTIFAFATAPGTTAEDGSSEHSPFTGALIAHLSKKGLEFGSIMKLVQMEVYERTAGRQLPYIEDALPDLFFADTRGEALPERDRLLLAMAKIENETRAQVERIAAANDVPLAPLYGALLAGAAEAAPPDYDEREFRLARAAAEFNKVRIELRALGSTDPDVSRLRGDAAHHLSIGAFDAAREALTRAIEVDHASGEEIEARLKERNLSEAASRAARAGVARTRLDYRAAAADFAAAAGLASRWDQREAWRFTMKQADSLRDFGEEFGETDAIAEAVDTYHAGLKLVPRGSCADDWADTHNRLGNCLRMLGEARGDLELLRRAAEAFRNAMQEHTREHKPLDWAKLQNNFGITCIMLAEHETSSALIKEAVGSFRAGLEETTFERDPDSWSKFQMNLGNALRTLGERETGTEALEESVAVLRRLLDYRTRERNDMNWAMTECILALALTGLGSRTSKITELEQAAAIHRETLEVFTRERSPVAWSRTHYNIALVLTAIGDRTKSAACYQEASAAFRDALTERTRERMPTRWAATQAALGDVLLRLARVENSRERFEEALRTMQDALSEQRRDRMPLAWASTQLGVAATLCEIGQREDGTGHLEASVSAYRGALEEMTRDSSPLEWASAQVGLGAALRNLGERSANAAQLQESISACRLAVETFEIAGMPHDRDEADAERDEAARLLAELIVRQESTASNAS
jgi:uncharacterized caspase-like protein